MKNAKLLVIDDEANILFTIKETLGSSDLEVITASSGREGIARFRDQMPHVVLVDVRLPDMTGLDVFRRIQQIDSKVPVIIMTAYSRTENAIEAIRLGAFEYLLKPIELKRLRQLIELALEISFKNHTRVVFEAGDQPDDDQLSADYIIGNTDVMQAVYKSIGRVAPQDVTVLLLGETGTGKELVARAIHQYSTRAAKPFLAVNCAALSESLLESELFGHERGAFTGADQRRIGKFEQVSGGTIFLDEIGDMTLSTQAKSLRLLQQQQFERLGGNATIQTDVRIIAATNKDLKAMVEKGEFRQDLYYRLSGFTIPLPPLRERAEDIPAIANHLLVRLGKQYGRESVYWTVDAMEALKNYSWPGNVRELSNAIQFACVNTVGDAICLDALPAECRNAKMDPHRPEVKTLGRAGTSEHEADPEIEHPEISSTEFPLLELQNYVRYLLTSGQIDLYRTLMQRVESILFDETLKFTSGKQQMAAELLGISRMTLRTKRKDSSASQEL
ncbi:MAG: Nitrogen assimilation regulatory protein [Planctomycetota bacterium]